MLYTFPPAAAGDRPFLDPLEDTEIKLRRHNGTLPAAKSTYPCDYNRSGVNTSNSMIPYVSVTGPSSLHDEGPVTLTYGIINFPAAYRTRRCHRLLE